VKISVITVCQNPGELLKGTIESVQSQQYTNIEYIVVDGASNDGTVRYLEGLSSIKYVSEKDNGIYNAMNKGISMATGAVIFFLNAGDKFLNDNIITFVMKFFSNNDPDIAYGDIVQCGRNERHLKKFDAVDRYFLFKDAVCHQSTFYRTDFLKEFGGFDEKYAISADYEFFVRAFVRKGSKMQYMGKPIAEYDMNGISSTSKKELKKERLRIQKSSFSFLNRLLYRSSIYQFFRRQLRRAGVIKYG